MSKESAYNKISELVERFHEQKESYRDSNYNETQTRRDFIDPFFKALGWDVDNEGGSAEAYREVIHEDKIKIGASTKAPDYSFRLAGGKRLFFLEAKKPSVNVKDEIVPAYQVRRYGWSAKLAISIVSDFEELAIYDCTVKPIHTDKASVARLRYFIYLDYLKEFDFIWNTFSKERVLAGSFDKFIQSDTHKKGTTTVDKDFLNSLDNWRTILALAITKQNPSLIEEEINFAIQQTIDRLIFLRIAEDRGVEDYGKLKAIINSGSDINFYQQLFSQFKIADDKYNSGLFDFKKDQISKKLILDNKTIKSIISQLYYPESPYEFSVISVEILGAAYEQFLGKTITVDKNHRAKIEEKPEVRKAGGVYYTPQYIVDYIVENTVGVLIKDKTPKEIAQIKIVDPACGSGSFLIGAYQYLLDWHLQYFSQQKTNSKNITPDGRLTTAIKKQILLNNIFGVDIDVNAVEVTKLSLLLKCMEGETNASITTQLLMFNEAVLPTLDNNIKSGNSLIDTDFYDGQIDFGDEKKIKPFNWQKNFIEVFKQGGFDCVIGNPPYVRQETLSAQKGYYEKEFKVYHGMADLYSYFIEKGINLLNPTGLYGVIVANKWMRANYGEPLRKFIKQQGIFEIIDFGDLQVFNSATTYPCILIVGKNSKRKKINLTIAKSLDFDSLASYTKKNATIINKDSLDDSGWNLATDAEQKLLKKIQTVGIPLGEYVNGKIYYGIKTGLNEAFVIDESTKTELIKADKKSAQVIKPFLAGRDIKRYQPAKSDNYLIFFPRGYTNKIGKNPKNAWAWLKSEYPSIAIHLEPFKAKAEKRYDKGEYWWELRACEYYDEFEKPKILYQVFQVKPCFIFDEQGTYCNNAIWIIPQKDKYLLAILNSKLGWYLISRYCTQIQNGYQLIYKYIKKIPIKKINEKNQSEQKTKTEIVKLVEQLLILNQEKQSTTLPSKLEQLQSKIDYCEDKINSLVYQLYCLTAEEIKIVEE